MSEESKNITPWKAGLSAVKPSRYRFFTPTNVIRLERYCPYNDESLMVAGGFTIPIRSAGFSLAWRTWFAARMPSVATADALLATYCGKVVPVSSTRLPDDVRFQPLPSIVPVPTTRTLSATAPGTRVASARPLSFGITLISEGGRRYAV